MRRSRSKWWAGVRAVVREYPELRAELDTLHSPVMIARYGKSVGGSNGTSRVTECVALREMPAGKQRELDAVERAIEEARRESNGEQRVRIIELVYWKQTHTLIGAAKAVGYSYDQAQQFHADFLHCVERNLNLP